MAPISIRNGKWSIDLSKAAAISALIGLVGSIVGGILAIGEWVLMPRLEAQMAQQVARQLTPVIGPLELRDKELAGRIDALDNKIPQRAEIDSLRADIQRLHERVEYLIRLQIEQRASGR